MKTEQPVTIIFLILFYSCATDKSDKQVFDSISIPANLTEQRLKDLGFEKVEKDIKTFYIHRDNFREIKYELNRDDIISRTYRIKYDDLQKLLDENDGQIIATNDKDDFFRLKFRDKEVDSEVIREIDGKFIEIYTDLFHVTIND
ncbi:MAG: hypothetical protein MUF43_09830 [Flavobacterium sp.]|jgi:hypothetical protein|nr:hypothetical protein [Flavobacterium sp.]